MKKIKIMIITVFLASSVVGQDITGSWQGLLEIQGMKLRLVFHISKTDEGYSSLMDSPDQNAKGIPVAATCFEDGELTLEVPRIMFKYQGVLTGDSITGMFEQYGRKHSLNLHKKEIEIQALVRPQEPKEPYPYYIEDVVFRNDQTDITLAGTLTLPEKNGRFPAAILITGSGAQDRNEEIMGHKPFLVIADYLTRHGIAVLRYDDRGTGQSTGVFRTATSIDFATDVESAITYLKTRQEIHSGKIGLIGHSEGGLIAPIVAHSSKDVAYIVMLAGPGLRGDSILLLQQELIARASGVPEAGIEETKKLNSALFNIITNSSKEENIPEKLRSYISESMKVDLALMVNQGIDTAVFVKNIVMPLMTPWMMYFIQYDPVPALEKVKCPVFALNGEKDLQVPPKENLSAIRRALEKAGNKNILIKEYPNLNHLFQECETGLPKEYGIIEQTISPEVLKDILNWVLGIFD